MLTAVDARRFRGLLTRAIAIPLVIMLLLIAGLLIQTQALLEATRWVDHTDVVIAQAHEIQKLLIDMETGVRGYLLTGDAVFLEPYNDALDDIDAQQDAAACISVTDQGIGIPEEALVRVFRRFYRANNADERHISGLGIGLYVVKEIITLHSGTVAIDSAEGVGSTFTVCLPLVDDRRPTTDGNA